MMDESQKQPGVDDESWMDEMGWGEDAAETPVNATAEAVPALAGMSAMPLAAMVEAPAASSASFAPLPNTSQTGDNSAIDLLLDVTLQVTVELGRARMKIGEILGLRNGSVIELDPLAGGPAELPSKGAPAPPGAGGGRDEKMGVRSIEGVSR